MTHILLLDNFDSFTYNLAEQFKVLGHHVWVFRNDTPVDLLLQYLDEYSVQLVVLSPGPGRPEDSGCLLELITRIKGCYPILGVCLGLQALVVESGGNVGRARQILHGKASWVDCKPHAIFNGLPQRIRVARYHSLIATCVPEPLQILATSDDQVMAVVDEEHHWIGFQFHPESILTEVGSQLLNNVVDWSITRAHTAITHHQKSIGKMS